MHEIFIYDDIGPDYWGLVSAKYVLNELSKAGKGKPVVVRINSPGGDVNEAQAIYNALRRHSADGGEVTVENDALAASAASYIMMAGDKIRVAANSMTMIHKAWTIAIGNSDQIRSTAGVLDKFDSIILDTYTARSSGKKSREEIEKLVADESWLTAQETIDAGLADEIGQELNVAASVKPGRFKNTPQTLVDPNPTQREREAIEKRNLRITQAQRQLILQRKRLGV